MRVLVFTDSRGQHKPSGSSHDIFGERLAKHSNLTVDLYLCPFKWTTTLDFLETFSEAELEKYRWIILYTGIVDWSPRRHGNAFNDIYNNTDERNIGALKLNSTDYSKKIVNNKKKIFDSIFGEKEMRNHFAQHLPTFYEGEPTQNMYSIEMAEQNLLPKLKSIKNLIYINSNMFVPGWRGDYKKERPDNMHITHQYSDVFSRELSTNLVDLREWSKSDVMKMTCDNLHLSAAGSEYIYQKICEQIGIAANSARNPNSTESNMNTKSNAVQNPDLAILLSANQAIKNGDNEGAYKKALLGFEKSHRSTYFHTAYLAARRLKSSDKADYLFKLSEEFSLPVVDKASADYGYLKRFNYLFSQTAKNRVVELAERPTLTPSELVSLEKKLGQQDQLSSFIRAREAIVTARISDEYWPLREEKLPFPYNYISDYNAHKPSRDASPLTTPRSISFIFPIKNRNTRVKLALASLSDSIKSFRSKSRKPPVSLDALVIEDEGSEGLTASDFSNLCFDVTHVKVSSGVTWTRSGLLNEGIKESKGDLVFFVDADVLFPLSFVSRLTESIQKINPTKSIFAINMFETHTHMKEGRRHAPGTPYSYMWGILRKYAKAVGGFSEAYIGWGSEDRDFEYRACKKENLTVATTFNLQQFPYVLHFSHDVRTGSEKKEENKEQLKKIRSDQESNSLIATPSLNMKRLGKDIYRYVESVIDVRPSHFGKYEERKGKTLVIMGNGPSLGEIMNNPDLLQLIKTYDTFGLNAAYRAYDRFNFYPTYFGSFDNRVCDSHAEQFTRLIQEKNPIKKFFFAKQSVFDESTKENQRFQKINFKAAPRGVSQQERISKSFDEFNDCGSSGTNAVQTGYILGYRHFILLGVDCNYVELLDGVKDLDGVKYEVVGEIKNNPNYWFEGYQVKGDQFHKPNEKDIQLVSWEKLDQLLSQGDGHVSNCSMVSKLPMFDILPFSVRTKKYRNIFLVMSCKKYESRIQSLRTHYEKGADERDLIIYVVGGSERNILNNNSVLELSVGDFYENLPQKVQAAVAFCVENIEFDHLIKVDDDVFINFDNFYSVVDKNFKHDYIGRRTPTRAGIKPSSNWHFGKVELGGLYEETPFEVEGPPDCWAGGGMYILSRHAAVNLVTNFSAQMACFHLYEDFMVGDLLHRQGIHVSPWESTEETPIGAWCITNLREIFSDDLLEIKDIIKVKRAISIHCGSYPPYYRVSEDMLKSLYSRLEASWKSEAVAT